MNIQHIVLTPGQEPEVRNTPLGYAEIVNIVGYPIEVINIESGRAVLYACEEGKQQGFPRNEEATKIAQDNLRDGDFIVGTVVIVGPLGAGGVDTSLSDETRDQLLEVLR